MNWKQVMAVLGFWMFSIPAAWSQLWKIDRLQSHYELHNHLRVLESPEDRSVEQIRNGYFKDAFYPYPAGSGVWRPGQTYWGKIELENHLTPASGQSEWVMQFPLELTHIEMYVFTDSTVEQKGRSGFFIPFAERSFFPTSKANVVKFSLGPKEKSTILFKVRSERRGTYTKILPVLKPAMTYFKELKQKKQHNALFIGFVLMLLIYNAALFLFARDRAYLYYTFYLAGIAFYANYNSGDLADLLQHTFLADTPRWIHLFKLIIYLVLIAYMAFLRSFLDLSKMRPAWDRLFRLLSLAALPLLVLDGLLMWRSNFNYNLSDPLTIGYLFVFLVISFIFIFPLYQTRDRKGFFIIAGIICMDLGIFLTILARFQTVDFSIFYYKVGTILELTAFSLGLAYRRRTMEREKQAADFELEKSRIFREQEQRETARLKELDALKSRLYTNITHEFRTPLTMIMGMLEEIEGHEKEKTLIRRNSQNLLRLVNQILDLSKLESGTMPVYWKQMDVIPYLYYLVESFHSFAAAQQLNLIIQTDLVECRMDMDEDKLQLIISNLISNAVKFTPEGGDISLSVTKQPAQDGQVWLKMELTDNGAGIPAEQLPYIFDRFYQGSGGRQEQGSGIGLALVRELVVLLGGKVYAESQVGKGSRFTIFLPIRHQGAPAQTTSPENQKALEENEPFNQGDDKTSPLLLLIEDNRDVLTYIKTILSDQYQVYTARNGREGLERALDIIPDIIISDVMMPQKSGYAVCEELKNDERTSHIPIILLTAKSTPQDRIEGLSRGADAYLLKPFQKEELLLQIRNLVNLRRQVQAYFKGQKKVAEPEMKQTISIEDAFLKKLQNIILDHLDDVDFSVADLCREAHLSHTQLYRKLAAVADTKPSLYIRSIRMQRALTLLQTTSLNIAEIAYQVGFKDPNYFSRVFADEFGSPPSIRRN